MLIKIRLELLFGFVGVEQKFLARPKSQLADIAKCRARCGADEAYDLKVPVWHRNIIAGADTLVKYLRIQE